MVNNNSSSLQFAAQLLACQVSKLFPTVHLVGGGLHSLGFYYDFIFSQPLTDTILELIERELKTFIKSETDVRFLSMMKENAQTFFEHHERPFLAIRAEEESQNIIELIQIDAFYGLCPALPFVTTAEVGCIKILEEESCFVEIGDQEIAVTRFIGTAQSSPQELKQFCKNYDRLIKKQDHRFLGPQLALYHSLNEEEFSEIVWRPKGVVLKNFLLKWVKEFYPSFDLIETPLFDQNQELRESLNQAHLRFLRQTPYFAQSIGEEGLLFRNVSQQERWGLLLSENFTVLQRTMQVESDQLIPELISSLHFIEQIITIFDFKGDWILLTPRDNSLKSTDEAGRISLLEEAVRLASLKYPISFVLQEEGNEKAVSLELQIEDLIGRKWTLSSVGIISMEKENNHQATIFCRLFESLDRLIGLLVEHTEGRLPLWLAPEQVRLLPIGEANKIAAEEIALEMKKRGVRFHLDNSPRDLATRIHDAEKEKIPYIVLLGDQERKNKELSVRSAGNKHENRKIKLDSFIEMLIDESRCPSLLEQRS